MTKIITTNKKAYYEYELGDTIEAGVVLHGDEIKALRQNKASLAGSYAKIIYSSKQQPELWLVNAHIDSTTHNPTRSRKLLVQKKEINRLIGKTQERGLTLIPTKLYFKRGNAKLELALGKSKKKHDKRVQLREKALKREIRQS